MAASNISRFPIRSAPTPRHTLTMSTPWYIVARRRAKELGLSYQAMADRLDVRKPTVGHWMTGRHNPSLSRLGEIAEMLELSVSELVADDERFVRDDIERDVLRAVRELPAEYRVQALAMLKAYRAAIPPNPDDD